jgi:hypothetical protein
LVSSLTTVLAPRLVGFALPEITCLSATSRSARRFSSAAVGSSSTTAAVDAVVPPSGVAAPAVSAPAP